MAFITNSSFLYDASTVNVSESGATMTILKAVSVSVMTSHVAFLFCAGFVVEVSGFLTGLSMGLSGFSVLFICSHISFEDEITSAIDLPLADSFILTVIERVSQVTV